MMMLRAARPRGSWWRWACGSDGLRVRDHDRGVEPVAASASAREADGVLLSAEYERRSRQCMYHLAARARAGAVGPAAGARGRRQLAEGAV